MERNLKRTTLAIVVIAMLASCAAAPVQHLAPRAGHKTVCLKDRAVEYYEKLRLVYRIARLDDRAKRVETN